MGKVDWYSFSFRNQKMNILQQVINYLEDQGVGTVGTDLFYSKMSDNPVSQIVAFATGGLSPDRYLKSADPTFQILVRNKTYEDGQGKIDDIVNALHQKANLELVTGEDYFYFIFLIQEPTHLMRDEKGRHLWSLNFNTRIRRR